MIPWSSDAIAFSPTFSGMLANTWLRRKISRECGRLAKEKMGDEFAEDFPFEIDATILTS